MSPSYRVAIVATLFALLLGCQTTVGGDPWFDSEWGGSKVVTVDIDRRTTTYPDGRVVVDEGVHEETAEAYGLSENVKGVIAAVVGFLLGGG